MAVESEPTARATPLPVSSVVSYLRKQLGERLTSVIAGVTDAGIIRAWAAGDGAPDAAIEQRLRVAFEVTEMLLRVDSADTVRSWFSGMNTELDDEAPALLIAKDPERVLSAARFFAANG